MRNSPNEIGAKITRYMQFGAKSTRYMQFGAKSTRYMQFFTEEGITHVGIASIL